MPQQGQSPAPYISAHPWALLSQVHSHSHIPTQSLLIPKALPGLLNFVSDPASLHQAWPWSPATGQCLGLVLSWSHPHRCVLGWGMSNQVPQLRVGTATVLNISKYGGFTTTLGNLFRCFTTSPDKRFLLFWWHLCFFQCTPIVSCPVSNCQWEGSVWVYFNHQFFSHIDKIPWCLLFSSMNNHISFSPYIRCFCHLIFLMAWKSGLKESVYEVATGFSEYIYSDFLCPNSPMKITWITAIFMSKLSSSLRSKTA